MSRVARVPLAVMLVGVFAAACQEGSSVVDPAPTNLPIAFAGVPETPPGPLDDDETPPYTEAQGFEFGTFWVCKVGTAAQFNVYTGVDPADPTTPDADNPITLQDGECFLAAEVSSPDEILNVRVEEVGNPATQLTRVKVWYLIDPGDDPHFAELHADITENPPSEVEGPISHDNKLACIIIFFNEPVAVDDGRMTGGGVKVVGLFPDEIEGELEGPVTLGLTLHCDILLSNNLEVNWPGHKWHIKKESLTEVECLAIPPLPNPPVAPIYSFHARALGHYDNGPAESLIEFTFVDLGEPGRDDTIQMVIYPGTDDTADPVLVVPLQNLAVGNFQMHYDQPHGQNK